MQLSHVKKFHQFILESTNEPNMGNTQSKVTDIVYHGSPVPIIGKFKGDIFWANNKEVAKAYGGDGVLDKSSVIITKALINLTKPYYSDAKTMKEVYADIKYAKRNGHDGVVVSDYDDGFDVFDIYVTFKDEQVIRIENHSNDIVSKIENIQQTHPEYFIQISEIVWHGSKEGIGKKLEFNNDEFGIHFGTYEQAKKIAVLRGGIVEPFVLDLKNPLRITDFPRWEWYIVSKILHKYGTISDKELETIQNKKTNDSLVELLEKKGYDGFVYENSFEGNGLSYVPFDKKDILSVPEAYKRDINPTLNKKLDELVEKIN